MLHLPRDLREPIKTVIWLHLVFRSANHGQGFLRGRGLPRLGGGTVCFFLKCFSAELTGVCLSNSCQIPMPVQLLGAIAVTTRFTLAGPRTGWLGGPEGGSCSLLSNLTGASQKINS